VKGSDCGNGLVVQHADGFETQYCHMRQGSVVVKPGQIVKAGQPLGRVGMSGRTEYAHLHFTVRHQGKVVDPFAFGAAEGACNAGSSLWAEKLRASLRYLPGAVLNRGFAGKPLSMEDIDSGEVERAAAGSEATALVAYVRAISLRRGDVQRIVITAPDGQTFADSTAPPLDNNKAQSFLYAGRKRPPEGWKPGSYRATYSVRREGAVVLEESFETAL
jgi:murein DD-endopeptidase MepM/ murein hydrolase activator NlpD